ncbi:MAG: hypothetical protein ACYDB2_00165 [Acidimicrobiales bacterium]
MFASLFSDSFLLIPVLFCGGGMALCMWMMSHGSHRNSMEATDANEDAPGLDQNARIAALEAEVTRLRNVERKLDVPPVRRNDT